MRASVLIPCRNERNAIESCLRNVYTFAPPEKGYEVIVIDGMSDDGTRDTLLRFKGEFNDLIVVDNHNKTVPHAMNLGIQRAKGEYIVRTDVRCVHPKSYLIDLIALSEETGADNVGGVLEPIGTSYFQKGIAASYQSLISMGGALRQRDSFVGETDAVYGGCFKRKRLLEIGMYDENMVRNQDDELSFRLRKDGGKIIQSTKIKVSYYPRSNLKQLYKQFSQYGFWKVSVISKHPQQASIRHIAPMIFVLSILSLGFASFFNAYALWGFLLLFGCYSSLVCLESARVSINTEKKLFPAIVSSITTIHVSFGIGFIMGLFCRLFKNTPKLFQTLSR